MTKGGAIATTAILQSMMPILVIITLYIIAKKMFGGAFNILGDTADDIGQGLDLGNKIGITKSKAQQQTLKTVNDYISNFNRNDNYNPFLPTYKDSLLSRMKPGQQQIIISRQMSNRIAENIHNSDGFFAYSPGQFISSFKELPSKAAVSMVADSFSAKYGSLWAYMQAFQGAARKEAALLEVLQFVNKLPQGIKDKATGKII